jgi:hypothetical protein
VPTARIRHCNNLSTAASLRPKLSISLKDEGRTRRHILVSAVLKWTLMHSDVCKIYSISNRGFLGVQRLCIYSDRACALINDRDQLAHISAIAVPSAWIDLESVESRRARRDKSVNWRKSS